MTATKPIKSSDTVASEGCAERVSVRVSGQAMALLQEAARVSHKSVSEFLLDAGIAMAQVTLADDALAEFGICVSDNGGERAEVAA